MEFRRFNSKVLLFGEYAVLHGGKGLAIPFSPYSGGLKLQHIGLSPKQKELMAYLLEYFKFLSGKTDLLNVEALQESIEAGLIFDANVPIGYGLGSSGVLTAAIYEAFALNIQSDLSSLKNELAELESFFHGKSSGLDPLVCFLNQAILYEKEHIEAIEVPELKGLFLLNSKQMRSTKTCVEKYLTKVEESKALLEQMEALSEKQNECITAIRKKDQGRLQENIKAISKAQLENLEFLIPGDLKQLWKEGLESDAFTMKLCGAGGGGFMLLHSLLDRNALAEKVSGYEILSLE